MSRVLSRRGLSRGRESRAFSDADLADALQQDNAECVYVELDASGRLQARRGPAAVAVRARLAPHVHARTAELVRPDGGGWRLQLLADLAPHHELMLWFHEEVLALIDMPFLTLKNIQGRKDYVCHECGVQFEHPNPLKVHLFLSCSDYTPIRFWKKFLAKASEQRTPMNLSLGKITLKAETRTSPEPIIVERTSAFRPYSSPPRVPYHPSLRLAPHATPSPAEIEALATDWGKSRDGHLCLYCGKLYSRKYGLKIHIRTHTGYKPLRCKYCLRAFGDPSNLNKHVRLHAHTTGVARHACARCGAVLARRRDLERHVRSRHQDT